MTQQVGSVESSASSVSVVNFGPFDVDLRSRELRKRGLKIKLQGQPFRVLTILLEHAGEIVTREELRQRLWPTDTFVDFDHGLNNAINRLRDALCDSAEKPVYIETLPRHGYRFIAPISSGGAVGSSRTPDQLGGPAPLTAATAARVNPNDERAREGEQIVKETTVKSCVNWSDASPISLDRVPVSRTMYRLKLGI